MQKRQKLVAKPRVGNTHDFHAPILQGDVGELQIAPNGAVEPLDGDLAAERAADRFQHFAAREIAEAIGERERVERHEGDEPQHGHGAERAA